MRTLLVIFVLIAGTIANAAVTANDPLPTEVLTCGGNIIAEIGPRLEGDTKFETGAHVWLKNGGVTVAYQDDPALSAIRNSKVGDHVLVWFADGRIGLLLLLVLPNVSRRQHPLLHGRLPA
jgi:hypothetical protein